MSNQQNSEDDSTGLDLFLGALGKVNLALGGGLSVIASVLIAQFLPSTPVPLWLVALVGIPFFMILTSLVIALHQAAIIAKRRSEALAHVRPTTTIVDAVPPSAPYSHCEILLIVRWSQSATLPVGSNVKVTIAEEHHERHLGLGTVRETLSNGSYVVSVDIAYSDAEVAAYIQKLRDKNAKPDLLARLRIGSTISFQQLSANMLPSFSAPASPAASPVAPSSTIPQLPTSPEKGA